jgi:hypothetical protein
VTPAKIADYAETISASKPQLADKIEAILPERRRSLKVEDRLI